MFIACCICFCWALGAAPLAGTEAFRALPGHEMVQTGDWLIPRMFGELYLRKPPMMYWVLGLAEILFGRANELVWRLPSALGAAFLGAFLCRTAQRWWGRVPGLTTGFAYLSLAALWSQFRSADIDALNTVFAFLTVTAMLEFFRPEPSRRWLWTVVGGVAFGATLLLKGPASLPLVLGAFFGPPIMCGEFKRLRSLHGWLILLIGAAIFAAYAYAVYVAIGSLQDPAATSGLREASERMIVSSWSDLLGALLLPLELWAYALPSSLALVLLLRRPVLAVLDDEENRMLRALVSTLAIALLLGVVTGMKNPRYGYIVLPLFAFMAGLAARPLVAGRLGNKQIRLINKVILLFAVLLGAIAVAAAVMLATRAFNPSHILIALLGIAAAAGAVRAWITARPRSLYAAMIAAVVAFALAFGYIKNEERTARSGMNAAATLAANVLPGQAVTTGIMLWTHPEMFYYAGVAVNPHNRYEFEEPYELYEEGWVLFHRDEWAKWSRAFPERFGEPIELPTHVWGAVLVWHTPAE